MPSQNRRFTILILALSGFYLVYNLNTSIRSVERQTVELEADLVDINQTNHLLKAVVEYKKYLKARQVIPPLNF